MTRISEDGTTYDPHLDACFLLVEPFERIVFTNAVDSQWRPVSAGPVLMTAEITLLDHAEGTDYRIVVRHGDPATKTLHADLGFADGWGTVTGQLAHVAENAP